MGNLCELTASTRSVVCLFCATLGFESYCFSLCFVGIFGVLLLAAAVNKFFEAAVEDWDKDKIRQWCTSKAVAYFLMLHYHTRHHTRLVLQHIATGEDVMMCESINSSRGVNELELMEILGENGLHILLYICLLCLPISSRIIYGPNRVYYWCLQMMMIGIYCAFVNMLLRALLLAGHGDRNGEWCTRKAVACFLMLHYHTRGRARVVLRRMEDEKREDLKIGEIISFEKGRGKGGSGDCCNICLGEYKECERVRIVRKCNHCFHAYCFKRWLLHSSKGTCPICRADIF